MKYLIILTLFLALPLHAENTSNNEIKNLGPAIDKAIEKSVAFLLKTQKPEGPWSRSATDKLTPGFTALSLYALCNAKLDPKSELTPKASKAIDQGFAWMREKAYIPGSTYMDSCLIMALEAKLKRSGKDPLSLYSHVKGKDKDREKDLEWIKALVDDLMTAKVEYPITGLIQKGLPNFSAQTWYNKKSKARAPVKWGFTYKKGHEHGADLSNTQYAALGLASAHRSGVEINKEIFWNVLHYGLHTQMHSGEKVKRWTLKSASLGKGKIKKQDQWYGLAYGYGTNHFEITYGKKHTDVARGFGYSMKGSITDPKSTFAPAHPYGSMTTAGLACILAGQAALANDKHYKKHYKAYVQQAIRDGVAWLGRDFSATTNPKGKDEWLYYYLYGMERVGMMSGLENFGKHLWYREGAQSLIKNQKPNGSWVSSPMFVADTCFGILFLSRATQTVDFDSGEKLPKRPYKLSTKD